MGEGDIRDFSIQCLQFEVPREFPNDLGHEAEFKAHGRSRKQIRTLEWFPALTNVLDNKVPVSIPLLLKKKVSKWFQQSSFVYKKTKDQEQRVETEAFGKMHAEMGASVNTEAEEREGRIPKNTTEQID